MLICIQLCIGHLQYILILIHHYPLYWRSHFSLKIEWEIKPPWSESVNENLMEKLASGEYCCYHSGGLSARKYLNVKNISGVKNICRINRSFLSHTHMANKWTEANSFGSRILNIRLINSLKYGRIATKCGF